MMSEVTDDPGLRPWRILGSRAAYADPWVRVRTDRVVTGAGDVLDSYHVVEYPDWTVVVALTAVDHRLVLVREYRHGIGTILTGLPGGLVDPADGAHGPHAAESAARRELLEETGYAAGPLRLLLTTFPNPSNQSNTAFVFITTEAVLAEESGEAGVDVVLADFVDVLGQLRRGEFAMHAIHVAALWSAATALAAAGDEAGAGSLPARLRAALSSGPEGNRG
jgi:8-oxo-dGTP pyrophosphatase MutT (NUDIX family)